MPDKNITCEIQEHFGIISSREGAKNKELNLISWNGAAAKYDIREWDEHHVQMSRGITLTSWEMRKLVDLYISRNNDVAVARGRAIEAERNARRAEARRKADEAAAERAAATMDAQTKEPEPNEDVLVEQVEQELMEGVETPFEETSKDDTF